MEGLFWDIVLCAVALAVVAMLLMLVVHSFMECILPHFKKDNRGE